MWKVTPVAQRKIEDHPDNRNELFEAIAAHSLAGIMVFRNGRVLFANQAAAEIYGLTIDQMMSSGFLERVHESDFERIKGYYERRMRGEFPPDIYEYRINRNDGMEGWVQSRVCMIEWLGEAAVCASQIDITAERSNIDNLDRDRRLYFEVIDQSPDGMCIADASKPNHPILFANNAFYEMTEYSERDVIGTSCNILQGRETDVDTIAQIRQSLKDGQKFMGEVLNYKKSGEVFWNRLCISPVFNNKGTLTYFVSTQVNITDEKLANERVNFLQLALDQLTERISILDNDNCYLYINNAIESLLDKTDEQLRGSHISTVLSKDFYESNLRDYFHESRYGNPSTVLFEQGELFGEKSDSNDEGSKGFVEFSTTPVKNNKDEVTALVVVSRDKTREFNTQLALTESEKRFRDIVDIAADWYWETDTLGRFTFVSPTMDYFLNSLTGTVAKSLKQLWDLSSSNAKAPELESCATAIRSFSHESSFNLDGEDVYMRMEGRPLVVDDGTVTGFRGIATNLSLQRRMEEELREMATKDDLTGLLNRREFQSRFNRIFESDSAAAESLSLMYIDVDRLKFINDSFGHAAGDELIRRVAEVLREQTHAYDCEIARIGGDEFVILFQQTSTSQLQELGRNMVEAVDNFYLFETKTDYRPGLSIGVVHVDSECASIEVALAKADLACYRIKKNGGRNVALYNENDSEYEQRMQSNQLQLEIRHALDGDGFDIYLQPIVEIVDNKLEIHAYELLLRMRDSGGSLVKPYDFIRAAESYGYIGEIDRWVISNAIQLLVSHPEPIKLSINLSGSTLAEPDLVKYIQWEIENNKVDASCIVFEITETAAIAQIEHVTNLIDALTAIGCSFVLDDFGSGLSSYKYIQDFKISGIKIDGSFIEGIAQKKADPMIVSSMVTLATNLNLTVVAEWVEDEQTLLQLLELGLTRFQGHYFSMPKPAHSVLQSVGSYSDASAESLPLSADTPLLESTG